MERPWLDGPHLALHPVARLTAHAHRQAGSGVRLTAGLTGRATSGIGLFAESGLELGLQHTFWGRSLAFDEGAYASGTDPGRLGVAGGFVLGAGLDVDRLGGPPLSLVATYRWFVHGGWLPVLPVGPKSELGLGVRYVFGGGET
ncbi:MAG: hypothetical protein KC656_30785 [Myxococcales bacterium]|nr:hypothetical protein [Myxococcales bacterium]